MANHGYVSTMKCACMDIDALNACGVYSADDLDNGVAVKLTKMAQDSGKKATGFEFEVEPATASDTGIWIVNTPEVGSSLEMQMLSDPRKFYNVAGKPMSIKKMVAGVDYLEMTAEDFTNGLPDGEAEGEFATIGEGGKWDKAGDAPSSGAYLEFVAKHSIVIGMETVPTVIMRYNEAHAKA